MNNTRKISKFLSLVLRHRPETIGVRLDEAGWVNVDTFIAALNRHPAGRHINRELLDSVVRDNDKQRFVYSEDGQCIRARQGHSIDVELGFPPSKPPETLLHGTPQSAVAAIRATGLKKMNRHHVHLHHDSSTAQSVGARRGVPVLLTVRAGDMHRAGHVFYVTENHVWLTDHVPREFIIFPVEDKPSHKNINEQDSSQ